MGPKGVPIAPAALADLASRHGGEVDPAVRSVEVIRIAPLGTGGASDLSPFTARRHLALARETGALLLIDAALAELVPCGRRWVHPRAGWALASILSDVEPEPATFCHATAVIEAGATVHESAHVGAFVVIMAGATVGAASRIEPHAVIYPRVTLGSRVVVGAGAVVGRPGFGWAAGPNGEMRRMPQLGGVIIEDDVEVGPLATVDAGTLGPTLLRRGVRLDAHVHVGHNVELGMGTTVAAQSGFAGSVTVGRDVRVGGQAGIADHARIGDRAQIAAKAGVIGDIAQGRVVAGYPAVDRVRWLRAMAKLLGLGRGRG